MLHTNMAMCCAVLYYVLSWNKHFPKKKKEPQTSKEWAIYTYDAKSDPFSMDGDSGSAIIDCFGCLGGLLTGGNRGAISCSVRHTHILHP